MHIADSLLQVATIAAPDGEPHFVAGLVELQLHDALRSGAEVRPLGDPDILSAGRQVINVEYGDALADSFNRLERRVDPKVLRLWMRIDEQSSDGLAARHARDLPGMLRMPVRARCQRSRSGVRREIVLRAGIRQPAPDRGAGHRVTPRTLRFPRVNFACKSCASSCTVMQIKQRTPRQLVDKYESNQPFKSRKIRVSVVRLLERQLRCLAFGVCRPAAPVSDRIT